MRKLLALTMLALLAGCSPTGPRGLDAGQKLKVMAATPHLASLAMAIAGDAAIVEMLPAPDRPTHDYSPTMDDRRRLESAHLLLINGLQLETFDAPAIAAAAHLTLVDCSKDLPPTFLIHADDDENSHEGHGHGHGQHNPHVWLCTEGAMLQSVAITRAMVEKDPAHALVYEKNRAALEASLKALRAEFEARLKALARTQFVSNHDAFPYFAREFGLKQVGVIQRTPGTNPTMAERRDIEETLRKGGAAAIFLEPGYDDTASRAIANAAGVKLATLDPFDSGKPGPEALQAVLRRNLETVVTTLGP
ncbi:MAG: zinc ABC transporter substrate-binding protein [Planctomycetes bacterium]|nr:zinc ABC transporter substrate-binding protein [Planctomycetota bacterium]